MAGFWNTFQPDLINKEPKLGIQYKNQYKEHSQMSGYPIKYLKASELTNNKIFIESTSREFINTNGFSFYCKRDEDSMYNGTEIYGNFGYVPSYTNVLYIATLYFEENNIEPLEGDLIFDITDNILFEITKVDTFIEAQASLRINNTVIARKIYCKHYTYSYKDKFDDTLEDEIYDDDINNQELDKLNDTLRFDIDDLDVIDNDEIDKIFGDLG